MTWKPLKDHSEYVPEVDKCRPRLLRFCKGQGLDLACGAKKIKETAIGLDIGKGGDSVADFAIDLEGGLTLFANDIFDFIFSSHYLEHAKDPPGLLQEWWRTIRPGGNLVLYLPHAELYPRIGQVGANPDHKSDFTPEDILSIMGEFASFEILHNEIHAEADEYSFDLVLKKLASVPGLVVDNRSLPAPFQKKALVIRYGGIGDAIIATPVLRAFKEEGYHVTFNTSDNGMEICKHNPNVDQFIYQAMDEVPNAELNAYWKALERGYDRVVNLSGTIEETLLSIKGSPEYDLTDDERRAKFGNVNYYDHALKIAGFPDKRRVNGEIFFSEEEEGIARIWRKTLEGRFVVIWALGGSGPHKRFPYAAMAMAEFARINPESLFITVGGHAEKLLELAADDDPNYMHRSGRWGIRNTAIAVKYADLVIGPETGVLNMAGCFDTPKICMLSHSSWANLCKHWKNDDSVQSRQHCSPCHKMIFSINLFPFYVIFMFCVF
jgi:ADP-heptose:LPS heptosyltransferase